MLPGEDPEGAREPSYSPVAAVGPGGGVAAGKRAGPSKAQPWGSDCVGPPSRLQGAGLLALDATQCEPQASERGSAQFPLSLIFFEASI